MKSSTPLQHSVQSRLVAQARDLGVDPNLILARYANERFLYRVSRSRHAERFVLKGAMLLVTWLGEMIRSDAPDCNRWNDLHHTNAAKLSARLAKQ